ncbi:glucokinase [Tumebacillus sp. BK434]|uniref:ROK family protein n=1 Tax=Tumebacillus sp. BK434 TaxID=2512169 RepID=UPI00104B174A|nr:ROK family protein [Tumebacillus sp. BK434]TCP53948.1 glucokinase [Tumebacillus sp. BK434]
MRHVIGIDVGGTKIKGAVVDGDGRLLYKTERDTHPELGADAVIDRIAVLARDTAIGAGLTLRDIAGLGIGMPAFLDADTGYVETAVNLGWQNVDLLAELEQRLGALPIRIDNDANIAALGEARAGGGRGARDALCVTLGTGVGGGVVIDGQLVRGASGMGGEIGHITLDPQGRFCNCGRRGCLETISSATGIVAAAEARLAAGDLSSLRQEPALSTRALFDHAAKGDRVASEVIGYAIDRLGFALANVGATLNPAVIVIGGGVSQAGEALLVPLQQAFERYALPRVSRGTALRLAELGNDAGVVGAALLFGEGN